MKKYFFFISLLLIIIIFSFASWPTNAGFIPLQWQAYESDNFVIFYHQGYESMAQKTIYYLEKYLSEIKTFTGNAKSSKIRVILQDMGLESSGYAEPWNNKISLYTSSPSTWSGLLTYESWLRMVGGHELTHIQQMNNHSGSGSFLPNIFGNLFSPNLLIPYWLIEGVTVYFESSLSPYEGRLNDGYYDAIIAARASANKLPSILEANYRHNYFPPGQMYIYGAGFVKYLAQKYGEEQIARFFKTNGTNPLGFFGALSPSSGVDKAARKVFGKTFPELFGEWKRAMREKYKNWQIDGETVIIIPKGLVSNLYQYNNKLYYLSLKIISPEPFANQGILELIELDLKNNSKRVLKNLSSNILAGLTIKDNKLYYLSAEIKEGYANIDQNGYGVTGILYSLDLNTKKTNKIFSDEIKAFAVLDNGDIIYTRDKKEIFGCELWKYTAGQKIKIGELDQSIAEMKVYGESLIIVSRPAFGSWNINYLDYNNLTIKPLINTPYTECSISVEDNNLYYSTNYNGMYAIYKYYLPEKKLYRLTHNGYAFNGVVLDNELYFKSVTADGEGIFKKPLEPTPFELKETEDDSTDPEKNMEINIKEKSGLIGNFVYLIKPYNRIFPSIFTGEDGLGLTAYQLNYSPYRGVDFYLNSKMFLPLEFSIESTLTNLDHKRQTILQLNYPLFRSVQTGLASLDAGTYTDFQNILVGWVNTGFNISARQKISFSLLQDFYTGGIGGNINYYMMLDNSSFNLKGNLFNGFNIPITLRGNETLQSGLSTGVSLNVDFTHKLAEVRKGSWPTTLYLADVYGNLFTDYTSLDPSSTTLGYELHFETGMAYISPLIPKVGIGIDLKGDIKTFFDLEYSINF